MGGGVQKENNYLSVTRRTLGMHKFTLYLPTVSMFFVVVFTENWKFKLTISHCSCKNFSHSLHLATLLVTLYN